MNDTAHPEKPLKIGIIGGSGLGDTFGPSEGEAAPVVHDLDTPFGKPSGPITVVEWSGVEVCLLQRHGPGHVLNPTAVPYRANIYAMKKLGVTHLLASGATGSLREHLHPGELVIADQVVDKTYKRPNTFFENAAVHVEFSQPFCPVMRSWLLDAAKQLPAEGEDGHVHVHDGGTYVCMEGPVFSTRAESEWHRQLGGDLIGMTCMPEAKLAREAELAYALIALPTDYDSWKPHAPGSDQMDLLTEIIGNLKKASAAGLALMKAALSDLSALRDQPSPAHSALALGIWSDKSKIDPAEIKRLEVLWGKYFEG
ncbi:MAG: MTAP family purine nucleoside phosphorylase [Planctomycetota bacterium]